MKVHFILYVNDQVRATAFYSQVLDRGPRLDVVGMTEFELGEGAVLGLMPLDGASRLLGRELTESTRPNECAELYLVVNDPQAYHIRAISAGGTEISPLALRDWGHEAAYSADPFGTILAFAREV